ncbi:MAG: DUF4145 domain-containing protein [Patescibacteria group bacterium]
MKLNWHNEIAHNSKTFICGYCGDKVAPNRGYSADVEGTNRRVPIYVCTSCWQPTFFDENGEQWPFGMYGDKVSEISDNDVSELYEEARKAVGSSPTAAVLACRKILMHVAVAKEAKENLKFAEYVDYLTDNNYVPQGAKEWVTPIKKNGNDANHKIKIVTKEEAEGTLDFTTMLLKVIYEYPAKAKKINNKPE